MNKFFSSQQKFIKKTFGELAACHANYGWVADANSYTTKVYGQKDKFPTTIVDSFRNDKGKIVHIARAHV
jgi:hypothetical protein